MKKVIFLMGIVGFYFISCSSSKNNARSAPFRDSYDGNTYAQKYLGDSDLLTEKEAMMYINSFKKHKYKTFGKATLDHPWSTFGLSKLDSIVNDPATDSVFFFLAAFPKKGKGVSKDNSRHPFVIMQAIPKLPALRTGKGSAESSSYAAQPIYFSPIKLCPPPNTGCRIPGGD